MRFWAQPLRATQPGISLADVNPPLPDLPTGAKAHDANAPQQKWEGKSAKNVRWPPLVTPHVQLVDQIPEMMTDDFYLILRTDGWLVVARGCVRGGASIGVRHGDGHGDPPQNESMKLATWLPERLQAAGQPCVIPGARIGTHTLAA
jgi:hypothetical protein